MLKSFHVALLLTPLLLIWYPFFSSPKRVIVLQKWSPIGGICTHKVAAELLDLDANSEAFLAIYLSVINCISEFFLRKM